MNIHHTRDCGIKHCTLNGCLLNNYEEDHLGDGSEVLAKPEREPVKNLTKGHKADTEAKSTEASKARNEVQPNHLWRPFKFCNTIFVDGFELYCGSVTHQIPLSLQRRCPRWQCLCHTRCSTGRPNQQKDWRH